MKQFTNEPKPFYNTISLVVRLLNHKGFLSYKPYGKTFEF